MFYRAKALNRYKLASLDGDIGKVKDFYFDDQHWAIRYLVADTGEWLMGRQVLISPYALFGALKPEQRIAVNLTTKQIENCPPLYSDKPVSQQFEADYNRYYGWPIYWSGPNLWGSYPYMWGSNPYALRDDETETELSRDKEAWDPHLRSIQEVTGYHVHAVDGEIGHIDDFIVDDETWAIRYLVVDTRNWWPGQRVLVSIRWIERVSWEDSKVFVNVTRQAVKDAPEYSDETVLTRDYERAVDRNYHQARGHWTGHPAVYEHTR